MIHRIKLRWQKYRATFGILHDRGVHLKLKRVFFQTTIAPALIYRLECWTFRNDQSRKIGVAEM